MLTRVSFPVSHPEHPRYGQHLSVDEVHELIRPTDDSLDLVESWLSEHGIDAPELDYAPAKDWITVTLPVETVERLLDTKYSVYKHEDGSHVVRTPTWSLPIHLHEHIISIQPTNSFFRPSAQGVLYRKVEDLGLSDFALNSAKIENPTVDQVCNTSLVTPLCLRTLYGTVGYVPQAAGRNKVALNNFLNETNNRSDVNLFLNKYRPEAEGFHFNIEIINNGDNQQTPNTPQQNAADKDVEGNLDAETIIGITYPTPLFAYNTGGSPPFLPSAGTPSDTNEPYSIWLNYILAKSDAELPQTISTSYADEEHTVPYSYATAVCRQFAQLGARGVSLLFGSGDSGVGSDGYCVSNDGKNTTEFIAMFPASCPYITAVGATKNFNPEVVAYDPRNGFSSGGGYSKYFPQPWYQIEAVAGYTAGLKGEFEGLYNPTGRAYPDLAAQGQHFAIVWDGRFLTVDGTSASTPATASIVSLLNDARLAAGKPPLGFLNPWLYLVAHKAFNDVTSGSALGCGTSGFPAVAGWDAVTGWGTPVSFFFS
jgi:tripeptidyl-peptidase-1